MLRTSLPPGFRFHPTDVELIMYYLKRKVTGMKFHFPAITELNIYKFSPWDLADKSLLKTKDLEWYFFSPIEKKYGSGVRTNRATETGYWKTTGKDRSVAYNGRTVGMIKTLVFYKGHAPKGERTNWVMYEYRIEDKNLADKGIIQDSFVVCKLFQKSGLGPKNGAQYGAPFSEEEWDEMDYADSSHGVCSFLSADYQPSSHTNCAAVSLAGATASVSRPTSELVPYPAPPLAMQCSMANPPSDDVFELSSICTEDRAMPRIGNNKTENARVPLEALQRTGTGPKTGPSFSYHEVNDMEELCAHQCTNQNSSAVSSSIVPGTSFSSVVSALGPSPAAPSAINMPSDMDDLPEEDITALLSMFTGSSSMIPFENTNKHFDTVMNKSVDALTCTDINALYDGLGDLDNLVIPTKSKFDFSNTWDNAYTPNQMLVDDDMIFLELKDLDPPLTHPAKATDTLWGQTDCSYAPYTCCRNTDGSYCKGVLQNATQNVSTLNQTSVLPEGPGWLEDRLEFPSKGTGRLEGYESDTSMGNRIGNSILCRQPEESTITEQIQRRGSFHNFQ